ncbi:hypothetical protein BX666DRAFT_2027227 [Dichotomocladium elegans]|nr:hypothetical protein BX666DRAFT_2027227 [Dichotomocladium elegans]
MRTLEDAIITETQLFIDNVAKLNALVSSTNDEQIIPLIDKLRRVEKKMALVCRSFKASIYTSNDPWQDTPESQTNRPAF